MGSTLGRGVRKWDWVEGGGGLGCSCNRGLNRSLGELWPWDSIQGCPQLKPRGQTSSSHWMDSHLIQATLAKGLTLAGADPSGFREYPRRNSMVSHHPPAVGKGFLILKKLPATPSGHFVTGSYLALMEAGQCCIYSQRSCAS